MYFIRLKNQVLNLNERDEIQWNNITSTTHGLQVTAFTTRRDAEDILLIIKQNISLQAEITNNLDYKI
jgi:hypothetical protein